MNNDDQQICEALINECVRAKEKGVALLLVNTQTTTDMYACSSTDPEVIAALMPIPVAYFEAEK